MLEKQKTPGYHPHIFRPPILLEMPFKVIKNTPHIFSNFSKIKNSDFFARKPRNQGRKDIFEK